MLVQLVAFGFEIAEITCPAKYFKEASSTGVWRSTCYGLGVLRTTWRYVLDRAGLHRHPMFDPNGRRLQYEVPEAEPRRPLPARHP